MRPRTLSMAGFTAFREPTVIDFTGAELFVLTGPTGSGKSSVIDAICFALYGTVPRLGRIGSVVSLGKNEARVKLDFEVEGREYSVSRLVVRQGDGVSQKDVRLEGPDEVVSGVREVAEHVESILGLGFDHFTRTVVLPQGRFAAFLEDKPAERDKLIKQLLDLGVFEDMRRLAGSKVSELGGKETAIRAQLHDLTVDAEQITAAERRRAELSALLEEVTRARADLGEKEASVQQVTAGLESTRDALRRLEAVEPPAGLADLGTAVADAQREAEATEVAAKEIDERVEALVTERAGLGELAAIDAGIAAHRSLEELRERVRRGGAVVEETASRRDAQATTVEAAKSAAEAAEEERRRVERGHAAHAIRGQLQAGDECPVCARTIETLPDDPPPPALSEAADAAGVARKELEAASTRLRELEAEVARQTGLLEQLRAQAAEADEAVSALDRLEDLVAARERIVQLDETLAGAQAERTRRRTALEAAQARAAAAGRQAQQAASALDTARDSVAALDPPVPGRTDPVVDWTAFTAWVAERSTAARRAAEEADRTLAELRSSIDAARSALADRCRAAGIEPGEREVRDAVVGEVAALETTLERMRQDLAKRERLEADVAGISGDRERYAATELHLRSNRFQQWLIEEAMVGLVEFANDQLAELASGAYSLVYESSDFLVIDHRNADATRSVRTLSGGETFLVSLALALALAERLVATSRVGTARIESMFLDEGFGTLDAETLETVASVVTELGSRERMVGLVTHVRELAEQIPTRFEVRRVAAGAVVERVDA